MGNEMTTEGVYVAETHIPEDATSNRVPQNVSNNVAVHTEPNVIPTNHEPVKMMDEEIAVAPAPGAPVVKTEKKQPDKSVKEEDGAPPPTQKDKLNERQVKNAAGGYSFKVCDMNRLRRFIVLGSEHNTYYSTQTAAKNTLENIKCLQALLDKNRHKEVLETITEYSLSGRVAKEDPILSILALCAGHENMEIRKAAFGKVVQICNIPTKLFKFLDLTQDAIDNKREKHPPPPQKFRSENRRKRPVEKSLESLKLEDGKPKEPSESMDTSLEPAKKKKKEKVEPDFKKVNAIARKSSGWGRMRRKAISEFYVDEKKDAARLLYLVTKYKQRHNWSHKAVVGYAHPKMSGENEATKNLVLKYCTRGYQKIEKECAELATKPGVDEKMSEIINYISIIEKVNKLSPANDGDEEKLLTILKTYGIREKPTEFTSVTVTTTMTNAEPVENKEGKKSSIQIVREHLPTGFLNSKKVWEALLCDMPMTALIRNLGKMSSMGLFENEVNLSTAVNSLTNKHKLKTARIHPMKVLLAMQIYQRGRGEKGDLTWQVNNKIVKALDDAFYMSFRQPEVKDNYKTGKNYMLCLDVSGSMTFGGCVGCELITPAMASVAMAWVTWNVEDNVELMAFGGHLEDMKKRGFTKDMLINEVLEKTSRINFGATDCSLPMVYALQKRLEMDVFIVYTDSDTWAGRVHPVTALKDYNKTMKRSAKLIVCGMQSNGFTIADPKDPNMMDIVGFDSAVPELISEFAKGNLSGKCVDHCEDCHETE
jgi:60 kDa SS-A/Ro ribonucleoprotein